jgi:hypothetical protein
MTLKQALAVLAANHDIAPGSFMYALHECDLFDRTLFWTLYNAAIIVGAASPAQRSEQLRRDALWTYRNILTSIIYHFDPDDAARIKRLPHRGKLADYLERIEWGFHPLINGTPGYGWREETLGSDLKSPQQDVLARYFRGKKRD